MSFAGELWGRTPPLEDDSTPKSPEGGTTDLVIRQARIIHELRTELVALKKFTACTRSHPHEAMTQDCELRTEIARLTNELAGLRAAPAVQGEPVAWMVYGNYTRQPFGMLCSAEAYMRGLLKSDPDGGYHIRPLRYTTPALAPAVPQGGLVIWRYELATSVDSEGAGTGWRWHLTEGMPNVPEGMVRNLQPYTPAPAPAQEVGLTDDEIDRVVLEAVGFEGYGCQAMNKADMHGVSHAIIAALRAKGGGHGG